MPGYRRPYGRPDDRVGDLLGVARSIHGPRGRPVQPALVVDSLLRRRGSRQFHRHSRAWHRHYDHCGRRRREAPRYTRVGSRCGRGTDRRCRSHLVDAPAAHQGVLHVGANDRRGQPVGYKPHPRRPRGRRSAVAGLSLALARPFPPHRNPPPVGGYPRIGDLVCARVGPPRGHRGRAAGGGSRGAQRVRKRHHDRTPARLRRRPVLGLRCRADRRLLGPRGTTRADALVAGPRVVARGPHRRHHDSAVPGPHHSSIDLRLRAAQGQARRLLRHSYPPAGPRSVNGRGDGCRSRPGHRRERDGQARARHHGLAPPRSGDP